MARRPAPRGGIRPQYELRARKRGPGDLLLEVWQLPSVATPEIKEQHYVGGLSGRNLALVEHRVFKQIRAAGFDIGTLRSGDVSRRDLTEAGPRGPPVPARGIAAILGRGDQAKIRPSIGKKPKIA